jgi:hypothetical protein
MALRGEMSGGLDITAIPISSILSYAEHAGVNCPVGRQRLINMIGRMSETERSYGNSKSQA